MRVENFYSFNTGVCNLEELFFLTLGFAKRIKPKGQPENFAPGWYFGFQHFSTGIFTTF
jgi:hypothetical protein